MHFVSWIATCPLFEQLEPSYSKSENELGDRFEFQGNIAQTQYPMLCQLVLSCRRGDSGGEVRAQNGQERRVSLRGGGIVADALAIREKTTRELRNSVNVMLVVSGITCHCPNCGSVTLKVFAGALMRHLMGIRLYHNYVTSNLGDIPSFQ